jgi:hypothetical protein
MDMRLSIKLIGLMVVITIASSAVAHAAPAPAPAKPGGGAGYSGGLGSDPLRFKQLTMDGIRERMAVGDEEWKGLGAKIERVLEAQRNARTGAGMSFTSGTMVKGTPPPGTSGLTERFKHAGGGNSGSGLSASGSNGSSGSGAGIATVDTPAGRAMQAIRAALDVTSGDAEILAKVAAMRAAREEARVELAAARKELHDACTPRQEAVLVTFGVLE